MTTKKRAILVSRTCRLIKHESDDRSAAAAAPLDIGGGGGGLGAGGDGPGGRLGRKDNGINCSQKVEANCCAFPNIFLTLHKKVYFSAFFLAKGANRVVGFHFDNCDIIFAT